MSHPALRELEEHAFAQCVRRVEESVGRRAAELPFHDVPRRLRGGVEGFFVLLDRRRVLVSELVERYTRMSGRDTAAFGWYDVFARWKLAIALEGSYAKFLRGQSDKAIHEFFGMQADLLLESASNIIESEGTP